MEKMKAKFEKLEEDYEKITFQLQAKDVDIATLKEELELKNEKVAILEGLVKSISQNGMAGEGFSPSQTNKKWKLPWGQENTANVSSSAPTATRRLSLQAFKNAISSS